MNEEIKEIREYISCPQFGDNHYGKWGVLNLEQRRAFLKLCDYIENCDNYITNLQKENEKLNKIIDGLENYLKVGITMNFNMNNNKFSEQTVDNYNDVLNKLIKLKKEVE